MEFITTNRTMEIISIITEFTIPFILRNTDCLLTILTMILKIVIIIDEIADMEIIFINS